MHPQQRALEPELEDIWVAAVEDASLNPDQCLLYVLDGAESETGYSGWHLARGIHINDAEQFGAAVNELLPELNAEECINAVRIVAWRERTIEGLAGLIRHELEHAVQDEAYGERIEQLYHLALAVLAERVGGLPGSGLLYTIIPNEFDANAAAAMFVRGRYGDERVQALLEARDNDSALFRSLRGPAPLETLPERLLAFFIAHRDLCEAYAARRGFGFHQLLDLHWSGADDVWRELVDEGGLAVPR